MASIEPNTGGYKWGNEKVLPFVSIEQDNRNLIKDIMKKYVVIALSFTLLFPTTSSSAVKKPAAKAVAVKKPVSKKPVAKKPAAKKVAVEPTPTPSPSTVVEAPKVVEPTPTPTPKPAPTAPAQPITFENLDLVWTSKVARTEILAEFAKLNKPENAYEIFTGPTVTSGDIVEEKRLLDIATTMFSSYFLPKKYQVVYFSERDANWAEETKTKIGAAYHTTFQSEINKWPFGCNFAFATKGKDSIPVFFSCLDSKVGRTTNDKQTAIHEYFHLVQAKYDWKKMPCWMLEGSATYFGTVLGIDGTDPTGKSSFEFIWQLARNQDTPKLVENLKNDVGVLEVFKQLDKNAYELGMTSCTSLGAYTVGSIATEALIAVKGYKSYMDFVSTFPITADWKSEFKKAYGLSTDDFYLKLAPYLRYRITG